MKDMTLHLLLGKPLMICCQGKRYEGTNTPFNVVELHPLFRI